MKYINRNNVVEAIVIEPRSITDKYSRPIVNGWQLKIITNDNHYTIIIDYDSKDQCVKAINKLKLTEL
jgi:hypothetical protein